MEEYKAEKKTAEMKISGMICASCSATIENALRGIDGVSQANVNLGTETASIEYNPVKTKLTDLELAVEDAGYGVLKERVALKVGGMVCATCVSTVEDALRDLEGVSDVNVNPC